MSLTDKPLLSIVIASYNMAHLLPETISSCVKQDYGNLEIIVYDDASTDNTEKVMKGLVGSLIFKNIRYFKGESPSGTGGAFNRAMSYAKGEFILLLCADDLITHKSVASDVIDVFQGDKQVGYVTRFYHQFIDGDRRPVRAWRTYDPIEQGNNPSGLAFREKALHSTVRSDEGIEGIKWQLSNKMFVEASTLVHNVLESGWKWDILEYDTVAVRIHNSISQNKDYYLKMWKSSPVEEWRKVGGNALLRDYTSLIQIKNNFTIRAVLEECRNFIRYRPGNLLVPGFWFYATIAIFTPRSILRKAPQIYRQTIGRWTTREVKRPE